MWAASILFPFLLFWVVLALGVPASFSQYFHQYSPTYFLIVLALYYLSLRLPDKFQVVACLGLTMILFALPLSNMWSTGFSDNAIIGGLLPFKDGGFYYYGANLILKGIPVVYANQATERPLFPGFLASVLWFTGQNLQITIAVIVQLMGSGLYLAVRQIKNSLGVLSASLFAVLLYFYIMPWTGYMMSETLGFALGCFGFALICLTAHKLKWFDLLLGLTVLMVAISARAGAFFVFPFLLVWIGWTQRGEKSFSWKQAAYALAFIFVGYFLVNSLYARLLGIPPGLTFRNFSYALYGQVHGGTGWHSAIAELGTRESSVVYRAAWDYFRAHPADLFIGFAKAYRDFFLAGWYAGDGWTYWLNFVIWLITIALTILGLVRLFKDIPSNFSTLLLAGFIGVFLSIPFLPPVDGGTRFYASTMTFFYAIPAVGIGWLSKSRQTKVESLDHLQTEFMAPRFLSLAMLGLILLLPPVLFVRGHKPAHQIPACSPEQRPFVIELHPDSYIDLVKAGSEQCGSIPEVCLSDSQNNNSEKSTDDFYQELYRFADNTTANVRIIPAFELVAEKMHYFFISRDKLPDGPLPNLLSGCATRIITKNQTIFQVDTISQ